MRAYIDFKKPLLITLLTVLPLFARAGGSDGGGGNTSRYLADKSLVEDAVTKAPILYRHLVQFAFDSGLDANVFVSRKNRNIVESKLASVKVEVRKDRPCFYPGDPTPLDGSAYNMTVCLSSHQLLTKKHSASEIESKVVGLFAHEMRHIYGAPHDRAGEILAEEEQLTFEMIARQMDIENVYANLDQILEPGQHTQESLENLANEYSTRAANARIMGVGLAIGELGRFQDALNRITITYPAVTAKSRFKLMAIYLRLSTLFYNDSGVDDAESMNMRIFGNKKSLTLSEYFRIGNELEENPDGSQITPADLVGVSDVIVYNGSILNDSEIQRELLNITKDFSTLLSEVKGELAGFAKELDLH